MTRFWNKKVLRDFSSVLVVGLALCLPAWAEGPRHGLMWNKTGLPIVFPLVVNTVAGENYFVKLVDAESQTDAVAAFIHGGEEFRIFVPPGTFEVHLAFGQNWLNEVLLFGEGQTASHELSEPLTFEIIGPSTKKGFRIDITALHDPEAARIDIEELRICQSLAGRHVAPKPRRVTRQPTRNSVGQDILEQRFWRGENTFDLYDRRIQQKNYDPPVLGVPQVPLARPADRTGSYGAPSRSAPPAGDLPSRPGSRIKESWC